MYFCVKRLKGKKEEKNVDIIEEYWKNSICEIKKKTQEEIRSKNKEESPTEAHFPFSQSPHHVSAPEPSAPPPRVSLRKSPAASRRARTTSQLHFPRPRMSHSSRRQFPRLHGKPSASVNEAIKPPRPASFSQHEARSCALRAASHASPNHEEHVVHAPDRGLPLACMPVALFPSRATRFQQLQSTRDTCSSSAEKSHFSTISKTRFLTFRVSFTL